jgi:hypothetical protein
MPEGGSGLVALSAVPELSLPPGEIVVASVPAEEFLQGQQASALQRPSVWSIVRGSRWLRIGALAGVAVIAVVALAVVVYRMNDPENEPDPASRELPEWFHREHRILPARGKVVATVPQMGVMRPPKQVSRPEKFTREWFEKNFTHYTGENVFVFVRPRIEFYSDGKLVPGVKVLLGEYVGEAALICICTEIGRARQAHGRRCELKARKTSYRSAVTQTSSSRKSCSQR